jgi:CHAD domain-containing protein
MALQMPDRTDTRKLLGEDPEAFLRQSLLQQLSVLHVITDEEILSNDPDHLHDFRVAIRTLRSRLKFYAPYFKKRSQIAKWQNELSWLDKEIQPLRDIDVQKQLLEEIALDKLQNLVSKPAKYQKYKLAVLSLQAELTVSSQHAQLKCAKAVSSKRKNRLIEEIKTGLLLAPIKPNRALRLSDELEAKLQSIASRINRALEANQLTRLSYKKLHGLRLKTKAARYLSEALGHNASSTAKAQGLLGDINDLVILDRWLKQQLLTRKRYRDRKVIMSLILQTASDLEQKTLLLQKLAI